MERKNTKKISIGNISIGGRSKIAVQSMLNIPSNMIEQNVLQAKKLKSLVVILSGLLCLIMKH